VAERVLYLVRHGQYEPDGGSLTALGRRQARSTARWLRRHPVTAIHASTMPRAIETAEWIRERFPDLAVRRTGVLRECLPGLPMAIVRRAARMRAESPEIQRRLDRDARFRARVARQVAHRLGRPQESFDRGAAQVQRAFARFFKPARGNDKHEILVCHGNLIRALVCRSLDVPVYAWLNAEPHHCGVTRVRIRADGRVRVVSFNETGHLPVRWHTES